MCLFYTEVPGLSKVPSSKTQSCAQVPDAKISAQLGTVLPVRSPLVPLKSDLENHPLRVPCKHSFQAAPIQVPTSPVYGIAASSGAHLTL